ncbi:MAG: hypothetical protein OXN84_00580 [Albidovulum sp.]|nr:hypothetical protein [Albidovulum sp.]
MEAQRFSISGVAAEAVESAVLVIHQAGMEARVDAAGGFGEGGALGDGVEAGEQRQTVVAGLGHDPPGHADPSVLHAEQRSKGASGRDYLASRHAARCEQVVGPEPGQIFREQEQPSEVGAQAPRLAPDRTARMSRSFLELRI